MYDELYARNGDVLCMTGKIVMNLAQNRRQSSSSDCHVVYTRSLIDMTSPIKNVLFVGFGAIGSICEGFQMHGRLQSYRP